MKTIAKNVWDNLNKKHLVMIVKSVLWLAIFLLLFSFPNLLLAENKSCEETWHSLKEWKLLPANKALLKKVAFLNNDNRLVVVYSTTDKLIHIGIWDVSRLGIVRKKLLDIPLAQCDPDAMDISPASSLFVYGGKRCPAKIIDLKKGIVIKEFRTNEPGWYNLVISQDGRMLAIGGERRVVKVYDVISEQELAEFNGYGGSIRGISFSPSPYGKLLSVASYDGQITIWDIPKREKIFAKKLHNIASSVVFSQDGKHLLTFGCSSHSLSSECESKIIDLSNFSEVVEWKVVSFLEPFPTAFSPKEPLLAIAEIAPEFKGKLTIWDIGEPTNKKIVQSFDFPSPITSVNFSSGGKRLVVGLYTGEVFFISKDIFTQLESGKD